MTKEEALKWMKRASPFRTICEVHREIFDLAQTLPEEKKTAIEDLVLDAFIMGKKMDAKLKEYKSDWANGFYEVNEDRRKDRVKRNTSRR